MNRQYLEYIPEIGTPAANSHHGQQQPLHQQPGCKAANPSNHHNVKACSPWVAYAGGSNRYICKWVIYIHWLRTGKSQIKYPFVAFFPRVVESPDAPVPLGLSATRLIRLDPPGIALRARLQATLPAPVGRAAHIPRR
jgi:hypothetical protein